MNVSACLERKSFSFSGLICGGFQVEPGEIFLVSCNNLEFFEIFAKLNT